MRTEIREALILFAFALFMHEVLTSITMAFVFIGLCLIVFQKRPTKIVRNALALGVLASYWFSYGKVIDPEVGMNFLVTVVVVKLLEKESARDQYMVFFGLLLVGSAGALFEKGLGYVFFYTGTVLLLLRDFYRRHGVAANLRELGILFLWILPLTFGLFFFVPRVMNPVPFKRTSGPGEIGYTASVNFASLEGLSGNEAPAFHAQVDREVPLSQLYWRGNTISLTDGWNWSLRPRDRRFSREVEPGSGVVVRQSIRLFIKEEFLFSLDRPRRFEVKDHLRWAPRYEVESELSSTVAAVAMEPFLNVTLPEEDLRWIRTTFTGNDLAAIESEVKRFFYQEGFAYTLKPGPVLSFREFMREKKLGFCSHFASALGLILRAKKIPARLVSGFMGGSYNSFGSFYLVTQNDAHVWVEAMENGHWRRLDPTEWIAPDRVLLGGEAFMAAQNSGVLGKLRMPSFRFVQNARMWFGQWDFRFYQWIEQVDYHGQEAWLSKLRISRKWLYVFAPLAIAFFVLLYVWQLKRRIGGAPESELETLWLLFQKKLKARGIVLPLGSVKAAESMLEGADLKEREVILELWRSLVAHSYAHGNFLAELKQRLKKL